ncbi:MAG: HlyD family secretion protein [Candidatus Thiodiazotropha sp.]
MNLRRILILLPLLLIGGAAAAYVDHYQHLHPSTSDAYLGMHVVDISAQVSGPVALVAVLSHQAVKRGDTLFRIDPKPFALALQKADADLQQARQAQRATQAQVVTAQAQVDAAQASLREARRHTARVMKLVQKGTASKDDGDAARKALKEAQDALAVAQAQKAAAIARRGADGDDNAAIKLAMAVRDQAQLDLQHTRVLAPADGIVGEVDLRAGSFVTAGQGLFALVETGDVWVDANFKETDLVRIHPGLPAQVTVDMAPGKTFNGRVVSLSPASGTAFSLFPPENATGNWVKVTQRFPVRVHILDPAPGLRLGASSEVTINTTQSP